MALSLPTGLRTLLSGRQAGTAAAGGPGQPPAPKGNAPTADFPTAPSLEAAELLSLVDGRYRWAREAKRYYLKTWATCLAFYVGEHYRTWDRSAQRLVE